MGVNVLNSLNPLKALGGASPLKNICCCGLGGAVVDMFNNGNNDHMNVFQFGGPSAQHTKYEEYKWRDLPNKARQAAMTLGLTEYTWDNNEWSPCEEKWWEDLSADEADAAMTLGWDMPAWDSCYSDSYWTSLPSHAQRAAESIGFTQEGWDYGEWPESLSKYWDELTSDQQKALNVLGYYKYIWD